MHSRVTVGCKVNFSLRITGVREDGYHELDSLFWPLPQPCDTLEFVSTPAAEAAFTVWCEAKGIDCANNTLIRAHNVFAAATGWTAQGGVRLHKGIPQGAGLGGGSSDAAAVLRWCNAHAPHPLPEAALAELALAVGADVPFFLINTPCRVQGIGERLTPCPNHLHGLALLLACPNTHISTPWAYATWDATNQNKKMQEGLTIPRGKAKDFFSCGSWFVNDFEDVVFSACPHLRGIKEELLARQACAAVMSGSGASVAAIFPSLAEAEATATQMQRQDVRFFVSLL